MFEQLPEWTSKSNLEKLRSLAGAVAFNATPMSDPRQAVVQTADIQALRAFLRGLAGDDSERGTPGAPRLVSEPGPG